VRAPSRIIATVLASTTSFAATPLSRDLRDYFAFGLKNIGLKNITVLGACNAGVNCTQPNPNSSCGVANHENAHYAKARRSPPTARSSIDRAPRCGSSSATR
jgi:hypothetical protein